MSTGYINAENASIYYEDLGSGEPLVLVHAGYLDSRMWDNQMEALGKGRRLIRYDVRGFGKSSKASEEYSDFKDLKAILDNLNIDRATILGVSNGGRIALDFAVEFPGRVSALVLVNSGVRGVEIEGDENELWGDLGSLEERYIELRNKGKYRDAAAIDVDYWTHKLSGDVRKHVLDIAEENVNSEEEDVDRFQLSPEPPAFKRLEMLEMPVLIIVGKEDRKGMVEVDRAIHGRLKSSKLVFIDCADHIPSISSPDAFSKAVTESLSEIS